MSGNDWVSIISSVGFPIVCCGFLGWYIYKVQTKTNETVAELKNSIDANNKLIEAFIKHLQKSEKED